MTATSNFVHLHCHSHFSLLDGNATIDQLVNAASKNGMDALALTDHGNMFGGIEFYRKAHDKGIKPIIGMEAYVAEKNHRERSGAQDGNRTFHLTLLARNLEGYHNLMKLTSQGYLNGFYRKPRIDRDLLAQHGKGLTILSGCLSAEIPRLLLTDRVDDAVASAGELRDIVGRENFYVELMSHGLAAQNRVTDGLLKVAKQIDSPIVATNDTHYICQSDAHAQEVMLCINMGKTLSDEKRLKMDTDQFFFRSEAEMRAAFADLPEAITNTRLVADQVDLKLDFDEYHLPVFVPESGEDCATYFRRLCQEGLHRFYGEPAPKEAQERLDYEMKVIEDMGFVTYFLVTWDFIRFARESGIPVGPGRGSAAGSIVAYCMGITTVDPLRYDLLFERFLNPSRVSMPDIDIDFCREGRERVINYVQEKYGKECVCQIITFGTMAARAAIRDVGRVMEVELREVDKIAKKIPAAPGTKLEQALEDPELADLCKNEPHVGNLFDIARRVEGLNRHCSTHAAGVVIADKELTEYVPLCTVQGEVNTQYTMNDLEAIGLLKMDFLGLKTLTIIDKALKLIKKHQDIDVDIENLVLDDGPTYELLQKGETKGVFQLESEGMRELLSKMKPDCFEDIVAILALYRPGPLRSGMVDSFVNRKHGIEEVEYLHEGLAQQLSETYGVIVYQEQVMRIANILAGFSLDEADTLRKAMGKKKPEVMAKYKAKFIDGAFENGVEKSVGAAIWEQIEFFAGYGFNKSHTCAYGVITYRTAYLKANFPTAFMAALLTCDASNSDKVSEYLYECRRMGIKVLGPHMNHSYWEFSIEEDSIRLGLSAVKGIGEKAVAPIIANREKDGVFANFDRFLEAIDPTSFGKGAMEAISRAGALDWSGFPRQQLFENAATVMKLARSAYEDRRSGQMSLFEDDEDDEGENTTALELPPPTTEWPEKELLRNEKEVLGFYITANPLTKYADVLERFCSFTPTQLSNVEDGKEVVVGGMITSLRFTTAKRGRNAGSRMALFVITGLDGSVSSVLFSEQYREYADIIEEDQIAIFSGTVDRNREEPSLKISKVEAIENVLSERIDQVILDMPQGTDEPLLQDLRTLISETPGPSPVFLRFPRSKRAPVVVRVGAKYYVQVSDELKEKLEGIVGKKAVGWR